MGMITGEDTVIALSNSGAVSEIVSLLPLLKRMGTRLVSMTGNPDSALAQASDAHLNTGVETEACPLDLAPTSSTTAALVMGDALAIALLEARGFSAEDFAFSHPGGTLGRKLLLKVEDVMVAGEGIPRVGPDTVLSTALLEISKKGLGMTAVTSADGALAGVFTDGDLRRALDNQIDINRVPIRQLMSFACQDHTPGDAGRRGDADHGGEPDHLPGGAGWGRPRHRGAAPHAPAPGRTHMSGERNARQVPVRRGEIRK